MSLFHVTTLQSLDSIMETGLLPMIGPRSSKLNEPEPAVYLFPTLDHAADAIANWLGEEFDDEDELVILEIAKEAPITDHEFEIVFRETIDPSEIISVMDEEMEVIQAPRSLP
jgi:RNA:NAD 2''-phosphotransferase